MGTCGLQALLGLSDQPELSQVPGRGTRGRAGDGGKEGKGEGHSERPTSGLP